MCTCVRVSFFPSFFSRFGHRFELPLLAQSVLMVATMLYMMHACVEGCYDASAKKTRIYGEAHPSTRVLLSQLRSHLFCRGMATSRALIPPNTPLCAHPVFYAPVSPLTPGLSLVVKIAVCCR